MGVDAKIFVVSEFGPYIDTVITLERERDLWQHLQGAGRIYPRLRLPAADDSVVPVSVLATLEAMDQNVGWIERDAYGNALHAFKGGALEAAARHAENLFNRATLRFVAEHYADRDVVIFWD